jgi:phage-related baseplate assembly protein
MIDLTLLPAPEVIEPLDFEVIFQQKLTKFHGLYPDHTLLLESDPAIKLLEVMAYQELMVRQRINDAAKASMLAYAMRTDLDNLAANLDVERMVVTPADPDANPPVELVMEDDERLRDRAQTALDGISTAGSRASYRYHAMSANVHVADAYPDSPLPGTVRVSIIADTESGMPDEAMLDSVLAALSAETVRPLCDSVSVQAAEALETTIVATLYRQNGPAQEVAAAQARTALTELQAKARRLGVGLPRSGIDAALHQPGISRVVLDMPAADLLCDKTQWVRVTDVTISEVIISD